MLMAVLKYKDPADGLYKPVSYGGVQNPVGMNDLTDADTVVSPPAVGDALVWNGTAWVPSGPAIITPPTPALITEAARWADGVPRFANAAARDAAYTTIGGPVVGMQCFLQDTGQKHIYYSGLGWVNYLKGQAYIDAYSAPAGAAAVRFTRGEPAGNSTGAVMIPWSEWGIATPVFGDWNISVEMVVTNNNGSDNWINVAIIEAVSGGAAWADQLRGAPQGTHNFTMSVTLDFGPGLVVGVRLSPTAPLVVDALTLRISMRP